MAGKGETAIQSYFPPTPNTSPTKPTYTSNSSEPAVGDGFTQDELQAALQPAPSGPWQPPTEHTELDIADLYPGPKTVTFMGRVCNLYDVVNTPKTPRSAKGCVKLCVKDDTGMVTVRLWYAKEVPPGLRLGSLVSVWTNHISSGQNGSLSSASAPLFASLFPERDRNCHLMLHENSDDGSLCIKPLGFRKGQQLAGLMTLQNFVDGGYDIADGKILVIVKSVGVKNEVTRKDGSKTQTINLQVHDNTAEATLGLWGTAVASPLACVGERGERDGDDVLAHRAWLPGETVLLLQNPGWKIGARTTYLSLSGLTVLDLNPNIPDTEWLRRWALRTRHREAINPACPDSHFSLQNVLHGPLRCLYTLADLDEFGRAAPNETFQGYLSVLLTDVKIYEYFRRRMLFCGECCGEMPFYANATAGTCKGCEKEAALRLNPKIIGQVVDETGGIEGGKLVFSEQAWTELFGRKPADLLSMSADAIRQLGERMLFARLTLVFGWTGDETVVGGRICVLSVLA